MISYKFIVRNLILKENLLDSIDFFLIFNSFILIFPLSIIILVIVYCPPFTKTKNFNYNKLDNN
jgi:hypothetical protein